MYTGFKLRKTELSWLTSDEFEGVGFFFKDAYNVQSVYCAVWLSGDTYLVRNPDCGRSC